MVFRYPCENFEKSFEIFPGSKIDSEIISKFFENMLKQCFTVFKKATNLK